MEKSNVLKFVEEFNFMVDNVNSWLYLRYESDGLTERIMIEDTVVWDDQDQNSGDDVYDIENIRTHVADELQEVANQYKLIADCAIEQMNQIKEEKQKNN